MTSKNRWKKLSKDFLEAHQAKGLNLSFEIEGVKFKALPGVFSPEISSDTRWFSAQLMPLIQGKSFLEIGSGTGAIACLAKLNGATSVSATDISKVAVENIAINAQLHHLEMQIYQGSVFDPIPKEEKFDVIFWNHPFNYTENTSDLVDELSFSVFDLGYECLTQYLKHSILRITPNGQVLLGTGNIARINKIKEIAFEFDLQMDLIVKKEVDISSKSTTQMDLRIYSISKK